MRERIRALMAVVFGVDASALPDDVTSDQLDAWDSLRHLELMLELEIEFDVRIATDAMATLLSLEAIEDYLREQGA